MDRVARRAISCMRLMPISLAAQEAGHRTGRNYSVQANLMLNGAVWPAMAEAFEASRGDLADRMPAALIPRLPRSGVLNADEPTIEKILSVLPKR